MSSDSWVSPGFGKVAEAAAISLLKRNRLFSLSPDQHSYKSLKMNLEGDLSTELTLLRVNSYIILLKTSFWLSKRKTFYPRSNREQQRKGLVFDSERKALQRALLLHSVPVNATQE